MIIMSYAIKQRNNNISGRGIATVLPVYINPLGNFILAVAILNGVSNMEYKDSAAYEAIIIIT